MQLRSWLEATIATQIVGKRPVQCAWYVATDPIQRLDITAIAWRRTRIQQLAGMYQIPPEQFIKDLQKRNGIVEIYDQVASEKTLTFLQQNAKIEDVAPEAAPVP